MKKIFAIAALSFVGIAPLVAQSEWKLNLLVGTVSLHPNTAEFALTGGPMASECVEGRYYRILHLSQHPGAAERERLSQAGISLLEYYPDHCWLASLPISFERARATELGISGVYPIQTFWKVRPNLQERPLPYWTIAPDGRVDLALSFPADLSESLVTRELGRLGYETLDQNAYPGILTVRVEESRIMDLASLPFISYVEPVNPPALPENYTGRQLHHGTNIASEHPLGRKFDGTGVLIAMGDDGEIGPHIDYQGRADQTVAGASSGNHGDHVAGTIMGAGNLNPKHRGMAFGADLKVYNVWDAINSSVSAHQNLGVMITSTSYSNGCNAGYTSFARQVDQQIRQNPALIHVFSAGNDGATDCNYGAGAGWGNITGGVKVGKNVITVGNVSANDALEVSSSRGPAHDGRILPHVCAKGTDVTSTIDPYTYASFTGTSMACPGTSGTTGQLYHAYRSYNGGDNPPSGLIKAVLMNTADDLGNLGPDYKNGFGRINALRAVNVLEAGTYLSDSLSDGDSLSFPLLIPSGVAQARIMIYWHDYEGSIGATRALVNDLDFTVEDPSAQVFRPWVLDPTPIVANLNALAVRKRDSLNNQEQITLDAPPPGAYTLKVKGFDIPQGPQEFFITWEFRDDAITVTHPAGGDYFVPGETEKIRWDAFGDTGTFTVEYSLDSGLNWTTASSSVAANRRYYDWQVPPSAQTAHAMIRVTRGATTDVCEFPFNIIKVPTNLTVAAVCPTYITLRWDSLTTAASYDVFMLGNKYMDSVGTTTQRTFSIPGTDPAGDYWFAVRAEGADGAKGRRTLAIHYEGTGLANCTEPNDIGATLLTAPGTGSIPVCGAADFPVTFTLKSYSPNTLTQIPLHLLIDGTTHVLDTFTGSLTGNGTASHTFTNTPTWTMGAHTVEIWTDLTADPYHLNDTMSASFHLYSPAAATNLFFQDWESSTNCSTSSNCGATNCPLSGDFYNGVNGVGDDIDWRVDAGGTPSLNTGPDQDYVPGTSAGKYVYLESTSCSTKIGELISPCIDLATLTTATHLEFAFHLYGTEMGAIHLDAFYDGYWHNDITAVMSTNWGTNWWTRSISLTPFAGKVVNFRWRGITGGNTSDMALDAISLVNSLGQQDPNQDFGLDLFPNPTQGSLNVYAQGIHPGHLSLEIVDMQGRILVRKGMEAQGDVLRESLDLSHLSKGLYLVKLMQGGHQATRTLSIQ